MLHLFELTSTKRHAVLNLIQQVTLFDGAPPIAEHTLLHLRHGGDKKDSHLVIYEDNDLGKKVIGYAHLDQTDLVAGPSVELIVDPYYRNQDVAKELLTKAIEVCGVRLRLWVHNQTDDTHLLTHYSNFEKIRSVLQMSKEQGEVITLPALDPTIIIRSYLPGIDDTAWLDLNNTVFKDHPEQGNWSLKDLKTRINEEWFDQTGFFSAELNQKMIGSAWCKIHGDHTHDHAGGKHNHPAIGELYITAIDQRFRGQQIGKALTITVLNYLKYRGLASVMLYVDEENLAAVSLYKSLGFEQSGKDLMYRLKS